MMRVIGVARNMGRVAAVVLLGVALVVGGCQMRSAPPALPVLTAKASVTHYAGDPLSGPTSVLPAAVPAEEAWSVVVRVIALEHMPDGGGGALDSVGAHARLIRASRGDQSVLPTARLTFSARYGVLTADEMGRILSDPSAGRTAEVAQLRGALPPGVTASFSVADTVWVDDPVSAVPTRRTVRAEVTRAAASTGGAGGPVVQGALAIEDLYSAAPSPITVTVEAEQPRAVNSRYPERRTVVRPAKSRPAQTQAAPLLQRELALLDPVPCEKTATLAFLVPFKFTGYPTAALAIIIEVDHDKSAEHSSAVLACQQDLTVSVLQARVAAPPGAVDWTTPAISAAMSALTRPDARRAALIYMAGQTNANLAADTALVADDVTLAELATKVLSGAGKAAATGPADSLAGLGWDLDLAAFGLLRDLAATRKISPELGAVLVNHAGEAGRHPSSLQEIGNGVSSRADLEARLIAENMIYLEDSAPGSRIRAYDFLRLKKRAPAGFDPLGTPKERRDALEKNLQATTAAGAVAGDQP